MIFTVNASKSRNDHFYSDNPKLWLKKHEEYYIRSPYHKKIHLKNETENEYDIKVYYVNTKVVKKTSRESYIGQRFQSYINIIQNYQGLLQQETTSESIIPPDDRVRITPTTGYPWRTICHLIITHANGSIGVGTGFIVGSQNGHGYHVLTAGHCVYDPATGGWVSSIEVIPARDGSYAPFWHAWMTMARTYTGWTDYQMIEHDWALITLDRNVGDYTGWMGIRTADYWDPIYTGVLNTAGYPGDLGYVYMYWDSDYGAYANDYNHWYYMDTAGGQSGSPVWYDDVGPYVLTIHAYGGGGTNPNFGTRINSNKFNDTVTWCNSDSPPTDYANLIDDGAAYSGFHPFTVYKGITYFSVWSSERNIGTANTGAYNVSYFASVDTIITTSDYLLGKVYVDDLSPFTYHDSNCSGVFPSHIPTGTYWVGWIIDSDDNVYEPLDNGEYDNIAYYDTHQLIVTTNADPSVDWIGAWESSAGRLDPGGTVTPGCRVRMYSQVSDAETPASDLTVTISYRPQGGSWTTEAAAYNDYWDYWYVDWDIPGDAAPGLYDVKVDAEDPQGGSTSSTELGEYKVVS